MTQMRWETEQKKVNRRRRAPYNYTSIKRAVIKYLISYCNGFVYENIFKNAYGPE